MSEPLYKKCQTCGEYYPGEIGDMHDRCSKHVADFQKTIHNVRRTRSVSPEVYDIYWKDAKGDYRRACRGCGKHLVKKNGEPMAYACMWRWCSSKCKNSLPSPNWGQTVLQFINFVPHQESHGGPMTYITKAQCFRCGEWIDIKDIDVHHVRPVSLLSDAELKLIWDFSNLQALCKKCHNGDVHQDVYRQQRNKRLDLFSKEWKILLPFNKEK